MKQLDASITQKYFNIQRSQTKTRALPLKLVRRYVSLTLFSWSHTCFMVWKTEIVPGHEFNFHSLQVCHMCPWPLFFGFRQPAAICWPSGFEPRCVVHEGEAAAGHPLPGHSPQHDRHTGQGQCSEKWARKLTSTLCTSLFLTSSTPHHLQSFPPALTFAANFFLPVQIIQHVV